jgi:Ca2+-binding EF-hand superfamily protein
LQKAEHEFDDDDIEEAFHLLDFDNNLFISKLELRHALTCLGEEVTDLEVRA